MRSYHNTNELLHTLLFQRKIIHVVYSINQRFYADTLVFAELRYEVQEIYDDQWHEIDFDPITIKKLEKDLKHCLS
ncbi:MAG: hypothetical protein FJ368_05935 [Pelagibacterales bacterium]|nr:hypothetical protein [Pelagibacterales bacterium]